MLTSLVDSDTRVPRDCLLDAVSEMEQSPEVGIMQFSSGVMQVVWTYFENGITFFTNLIYTAIRYTVSNGDVAPFVGHNAILRWSAIQQVSFFDEDGYEKFWSESHVSEDFDMSLRLQCAGYIIRLAAWAGEGFKEGVSLTVYDELARWEKYAYGLQRTPVPSGSSLAHPWPIHTTISSLLVQQHPVHVQGDDYQLHRNLLRPRCSMDPDDGQLPRNRMVQRVLGQILHRQLESVVLDCDCLQRSRKHRTGDYALPNRHTHNVRISTGKRQMDADAGNIPRRSELTCLAGVAGTHVRDGHDLGARHRKKPNSRIFSSKSQGC